MSDKAHRVYYRELSPRKCSFVGCKKSVYGLLDFCIKHRSKSIDFRAYEYSRQKYGVVTVDLFYLVRELKRAEEVLREHRKNLK